LPFAGMSAVRVTFERDTRKIGWGIALVMVALLVLAVAGPLERFATDAASEMAKSDQGVGKALHGLFRLTVALASLLPVVALACLIGAAALVALGWMGRTTLVVSLSGAERVYPARGRGLERFVRDRIVAPARKAAGVRELEEGPARLGEREGRAVSYLREYSSGVVRTRFFSFERAYLGVLRRKTSIDAAPVELRERIRAALIRRERSGPPD